MLIDNVTIEVKAGDGGNGAATFRRTAGNARGGPDGGNGGHGGDILFQGSTNVNDLRYFRFKKKIVGENGGHGTRHNGFGRNATHIIVEVPLGTRITNTETGRVIEIETEDKPVLIARGGVGGYGNVKFKSATNQAPTTRELGGVGERKILLLELRLIAEIGLIGLPNAGKSSLLAKLTNAKPDIGAYPFTTLEPNIGMMGVHPIADIPGLIEGAHKGVGLGIRFLKHIEKTKVLVHCIDISGEDLLKDYETVRSEFRQFSDRILEKQEIIFLNKSDLVEEGRIKEAILAFSGRAPYVLVGSVYDEKSMDTLRKTLVSILEDLKE